MPFEPTVRWAAEEGFDFVEPLLDGPHARGRIADGVVSMRSAPADARTDIVVHLPFAVDPGSPFAPVRDGAVDELVAGMGLAADLGTETVSSISRLTPGTPAGPGTATLEVGTEDCDTIAPGRRHVEALFGD
jgi:sugar phosphate isomerase/epimerase